MRKFWDSYSKTRGGQCTNFLDRPLYTNSPTMSKRVRLLRDINSKDKRFRLIISAVERLPRGPPREERTYNSTTLDT